MPTLTANIDAYGTFGRASVLADLLEVQALTGQSWDKFKLADYVRDARWVPLLREQFAVAITSHGLIPETEDDAGDLGDQVSEAQERVEYVFAIIEERIGLLGDRYPFRLDNGRVRYEGHSSKVYPYLVLLALTICHAYGIAAPEDPKRYFEDLITSALAARGYLAANLAKYRRLTGNFPDALLRAGVDCDLYALPEEATYRHRAQEEGVDVIAHFPWHDDRRIHWTLIVQATCAVSDDWKKKMWEPGAPMWMHLLGTLTMPQVALSVPHHVEKDHVRYLFEHTGGDRLLLDRIRLSYDGAPVDAIGTAFVETLRTTRVKFDS